MELIENNNNFFKMVSWSAGVIFYFISITNLLKKTSLNAQYYENTNSKGDLVLKNRFETFVLKISDTQK